MSSLCHVMHWAALSTWDIRLQRRMRSKSKAARTAKSIGMKDVVWLDVNM